MSAGTGDFFLDLENALNGTDLDLVITQQRLHFSSASLLVYDE